MTDFSAAVGTAQTPRPIGDSAGHPLPNQSPGVGSRPLSKQSLMNRLIHWMCLDRRVSNRHQAPRIIAHLGAVHSGYEYQIRDVSIGGFYMITDDRWALGTVVPLTLVRTDDRGMTRTLAVTVTVIRTGIDGIGLSFQQSVVAGNENGENRASTRIDLTKLAQFLKGLPLTASGQLLG